MELEFSSDQDELRDSIRAVLTRESPVSLARKVGESGARPTELWNTMVELGWPALTVPEADGGIGLGMLEAAILAEELGRVIAPGPLLPTVTQFVPAVRECGTDEQQARFLGQARCDRTAARDDVLHRRQVECVEVGFAQHERELRGHARDRRHLFARHEFEPNCGGAPIQGWSFGL